MPLENTMDKKPPERPEPPATFRRFYAALHGRHLSRASIGDIRRGIQAISSLYVERRGEAPPSRALEGEAKRAAFALFYGSIHFVLVARILRELGALAPSLAPETILDLGCGTGAAGVAWALESGGTSRYEGVDSSGWAVEETRWILSALGLPGRARRSDLARVSYPGAGSGIILACALNELDPRSMGRVLTGLLRAAEDGARILIVEPIARPVTPWWGDWRRAFVEQGGRDDEWHFRGALPEELVQLDRSSGLAHGELTARSLWLGMRLEARGESPSAGAPAPGNPPAETEAEGTEVEEEGRAPDHPPSA
jgi:hypothetical protein